MTALTDISVIKPLLEKNGFRFSKSKGQNFLTAAWVPERIADSCLADGDTAALEIGPGVGCLTQQLALRAGAVLAVEVDEALRPVLAETMAPYPNVEVLFGDAMKLDLDALLTGRFGGRRCVACANLPYNITTPVLAKLYECRRLECITVMIQREVALRVHPVAHGAGGAVRRAAGLLHASAESHLGGHPPAPQGRPASPGVQRGTAFQDGARRLCPAQEDPGEFADERLSVRARGGHGRRLFRRDRPAGEGRAPRNTGICRPDKRPGRARMSVFGQLA